VLAMTEKQGKTEKLENKKSLIKKTSSYPQKKDPLDLYFEEINKYPILTKEEEAVIAKHYQDHQDKESAQKLVVSNLRLVVKIAMEYKRAYHNILDLIQEGNLGLMRAVQKYDLDKGTRFTSYASWWIRAYILKHIIDNFRLVKIGTTQAQKKLFYNLMKEKQKMEAMGFTPKTKLLSERLDVKEKEIIEMEQRISRGDMSLDAPSPSLDGKSNMEMFSNEDESAEDQAVAEDLKQRLFENLDEFVKGLKEKEKKVFLERLYAEVPKTLQEIADNYGITRERIRQIEEKVIEKLKIFFGEKGFEVDLTK
jgi:RNA polymerase sigma-32 factor